MATSRFHSAWFERAFDGTAALDMDGSGAATFKLAILTSVPTINADTTSTYSAVSANEVSGTNYTSGGFTLSGVTAGLDGSNNWAFDANDLSEIAQSGSGLSNGRQFIVYETVGGYIVYSHTADADFGNVGGPLNIGFDAAGILGVTI